MPLTREIRIIKVPLSDKERLPDYKQSFPRMQRLYLELLENKSKIKQDLINKEYVPANTDNSVLHEHKQNSNDKSPKRSEIKEKQEDSDTVSISDSSSQSEDGDKNKYKEDREIDEDSKRSTSVDSEDSRDTRQSKETQETQESRESRANKSESIQERQSKDTDRDDLSDRLKELLGETDDEKSRSSSSESDKYNKPDKRSLESKTSKYTPYDKYKQMREQSNVHPPTLAELEAKGQYQGKAELRDINHISMNEHETEDKKREIIFKFNLLKKSYPLAASTIPEYTVHSDLREMQKSYDDAVRRLSLDSAVENYKTYLLGGFMLVEYVFGSFLGFDMQGFTQQQIVGMHNYEKLLIELGEKSYVPSGSKWPVELRLLFVIILNAGFFIVSKMIMRKTGANLMNMVNSMNQTNTAATTQGSVRQKRRMKGPNINIDEIPDADEHEAKRED